MTAAAIMGQLVDVKNVNTHKCVRLIIDVPAEYAVKVIDAFGWPTQVNPVPVAIARLTAEAAQPREPAHEVAQTSPAVASVNADTGLAPRRADRRAWETMGAAQQAGMLCTE